jgi:hypothetical protein
MVGPPMPDRSKDTSWSFRFRVGREAKDSTQEELPSRILQRIMGEVKTYTGLQRQQETPSPP